MPWELGTWAPAHKKKPPKPLNKRLSPHRRRGHCCPGSQRPWECPAAPWPRREGAGDGSRLLPVSHSGKDQPLPRPGAGIHRPPWQGCLTFAVQHKIKSPLQSTQGLVSDCLRLQGEGKLNYLESQHCSPTLCAGGQWAQPGRAEARSPKGWKGSEGEHRREQGMGPGRVR